MADQWPVPTYVDGDFTTAQPVGVPVFRSPLPATTAEYVFDQPFVQFRKYVSALALGTAHPSSGKTPDYSTYVLVSEGPKEDLGGGVVRWQRTYAALPASHDEWETASLNIIGTSPLGPLSSAYVGRYRRTIPVTTRVQHDYFLIDSGATETTYVKHTPGNIPTLRAFDWVQQYLAGSPAVQYGGWHQKSDYVSDSYIASTNVGVLLPTVPTESQYAAMIKDAAVNGWNAGTSFEKLTSDLPPIVDLTGAQTYPTAQTAFTKRDFPAVTSFYGQFAVEDSRIMRWMGPFYVRQARFVLAI